MMNSGLNSEYLFLNTSGFSDLLTSLAGFASRGLSTKSIMRIRNCFNVWTQSQVSKSNQATCRADRLKQKLIYCVGCVGIVTLLTGSNLLEMDAQIINIFC